MTTRRPRETSCLPCQHTSHILPNSIDVATLSHVKAFFVRGKQYSIQISSATNRRDFWLVHESSAFLRASTSHAVIVFPSPFSHSPTLSLASKSPRNWKASKLSLAFQALPLYFPFRMLSGTRLYTIKHEQKNS